MVHLHTDIGHDPDDIIALSYLISRGDYVPSAVSISPGFKEQVLIVDSIYREFGLDRPRMFVSTTPTKSYTGSKEVYKIISRGVDDSAELLEDNPVNESTLLVIGPAKNLRADKCHRMIFQGGYSPNSVSPLEKFKLQMSAQSFNPCGAKKEFSQLLNNQGIENKYYVGKNVCHGYTKRMCNITGLPKILQSYYDGLSPDKAMHDVLAAKMMINKEIGIWEQARPLFTEGVMMTTEPTEELIWTLTGLRV